MKQFKVALSEPLRGVLEVHAEKAGRSLAEEIRVRLERSLANEPKNKPTAHFLFTIEHLIEMVEQHYGYDWFEHRDTVKALSKAIATRLHRLQPDAIVVQRRADQQPNPIVASDDPDAVGVALEAIAFSSPAVEEERVKNLKQELERFQKLWDKERKSQRAAKPKKGKAR